MGLASLLLGKENPFSQFVDSRQNTLGAWGAGLASGPSFQQGLSNAVQYGAQAAPLDQQAAEKRRAEEEAKASMNRTAEYLRSVPGGEPFADAIEKGGVDASTAFKGWFEFSRPKPPGDPVKGIEINGRLVNPVTGQEMGNYSDPAEPPKPDVSVINGRLVNNVNGQVIGNYPAQADPADAAKAELAAGQREISTNTITDAAAKARKLATGGNTGVSGAMWGWNPESDAAELRRQVGVLTSKASIQNLQAMRDASATGGALGAVSDRENAMLAAASGAIDPNAKKEDFIAALDNYERTLLQIVHGPVEGDRIFQATRNGGAVGGVGGSDPEIDAILRSVGVN